jgi:cephalosporin-C deacetylase-like acetyl esterase
MFAQWSQQKALVFGRLSESMMFLKSTGSSFCFLSAAIISISIGAFAQQPASVPSPGVPRSAPEPARPQVQPTPGLDPKTGIPIYETIREDWASLQIGNSELTPEPPVASDPDVQANFTRQLVVVKWRPGDPIDLWIAMPKGVKNPPVVLYLYGYKEDTERFRDNAWCERVTSGGVAAVGFVSALTGHRFHDRPMRQWFVSELQESLGSTVHDVKFILDYLASRGDVDMTKVGMFGEGSGGAIAVLAAAADPRIKAIDLLEPWGDWPRFLADSVVVREDPTYASFVKPEFLKKVEPLDPVKWLPQLKIPIRMQQVKDDNAVPMPSKEALKDAAPKQTEVRRFETKLAMFQVERGGVLFSWVKDRLYEIGRKTSTAVETAADQHNSAH